MNKPFFELVQQDDKYVLDVSDTLNDMFRAFHQRLETLCEADFDQFARKLGYTKLGPGQCVVQAEDLTRIVTWFRGDARTVPHADMDTTLNRFTAALDASDKEDTK